MKIAITGTHSSGKTTLAKLCSNHLGLRFMRGDTIQDIMEEHFPGKSLEGLNDKENWQLENLGLKSRVEAEEKYQTFISDGCSLNSVVYLKAKLGENINKIEGFNAFYNLAIDNAKNYDLIIYLPPEIPLEDNGFRPLSEEFRLEINSLLREILKGYKYHTVTGTRMGRLKKVENIIQKYKESGC